MEAVNTIHAENASPVLLHSPPMFGLRASEESRTFTIRAADEDGHRSSANILITRRYGWRGYRNTSLPAEQTSNCITLCATEGDEAVGTITVRLDDGAGLQAEETFPGEVETLRQHGWRICEFTKLAMDPITHSKRVLASLFHVAYIIAHRTRGYDMLLIEVNPRHVGYYRRMLGCQVLGKQRLNRRVDAPAVLLSLDFNHTRRHIGSFGGRPELAARERSLYPYAFSPDEESGIMARLDGAKLRWGRKPVAAS